MIKFYGMKLFLIWYQILNTNKTHVEELMFQKLIQGFDTFHSSAQIGSSSIGIDLLSAEAQKVFNSYDSNALSGTAGASSSSVQIGRTIYPFEVNPIIPIQPNEPQIYSSNQPAVANSSSGNSVYNLTAEMLRKMLEYMQQDVSLGLNENNFSNCSVVKLIYRKF